jgi:hypothetical protein
MHNLVNLHPPCGRVSSFTLTQRSCQHRPIALLRCGLSADPSQLVHLNARVPRPVDIRFHLLPEYLDVRLPCIIPSRFSRIPPWHTTVATCDFQHAGREISVLRTQHVRLEISVLTTRPDSNKFSLATSTALIACTGQKFMPSAKLFCFFFPAAIVSRCCFLLCPDSLRTI